MTTAIVLPKKRVEALKEKHKKYRKIVDNVDIFIVSGIVLFFFKYAIGTFELLSLRFIEPEDRNDKQFLIDRMNYLNESNNSFQFNIFIFALFFIYKPSGIKPIISYNFYRDDKLIIQIYIGYALVAACINIWFNQQNLEIQENKTLFIWIILRSILTVIHSGFQAYFLYKLFIEIKNKLN